MKKGILKTKNILNNVAVLTSSMGILMLLMSGASGVYTFSLDKSLQDPVVAENNELIPDYIDTKEELQKEYDRMQTAHKNIAIASFGLAGLAGAELAGLAVLNKKIAKDEDLTEDLEQN